MKFLSNLKWFWNNRKTIRMGFARDDESLVNKMNKYRKELGDEGVFVIARSPFKLVKYENIKNAIRDCHDRT